VRRARHPLPHARAAGTNHDRKKACATLGVACKSNRDCCHDFLCTRDPGGGGYGDLRCA
jgi:hypothetical protein